MAFTAGSSAAWLLQLLLLRLAPRLVSAGASSAAAQCRGLAEDPDHCVVFAANAQEGDQQAPAPAVDVSSPVEANCTGGWQFGPPGPKTLEPCICDPRNFGCPASDPAFDLSHVQFAGSFLNGMVLQRGPSAPAVFGTATPGAAVQVHVAGPGGWTFSTHATASTAAAAELRGTWKVILPARPASVGGYTLTAECASCANRTAQVLADVSFGDM
jgi:hypothetical protein